MLYLCDCGTGSLGLGYSFWLVLVLRVVTLIDGMLFCKVLLIIDERVCTYGIDRYWIGSVSVVVGEDKAGTGCGSGG